MVQSADSGFVLRDLRKVSERREVVRGINLELEAGEIVGLLGPNGAGKTTIFDMVVGLCQPDDGRIVLNGKAITHLPMYQRARRGVGYLPQEPSVFRRLSVEQNIMAVLETLHLSREQSRTRLEGLLQELSLTPLRKKWGIYVVRGRTATFGNYESLSHWAKVSIAR